jgi:hypothetical protein
MGSGKATGPARDYQVLAGYIIARLSEPGRLEPWAGDGIDVAVPVGGDVKIVFDIALVDVERAMLVVAECKRWRQRSPIEQDDLFTFCGKVDALRRALISHSERQAARPYAISGLFVATSDYRLGAAKVAQLAGITAIRLSTGPHPLPDFTLTYVRYDRDHEQKVTEDHRRLTVVERVTLTETLSVARSCARCHGALVPVPGTDGFRCPRCD